MFPYTGTCISCQHVRRIWRPVSKPQLIRTNIHPLEILNQKHILESQRQRPQQPLLI